MINDKMTEENMIANLNPLWRRALLTTHTFITDVATVVWSPVTWFTEQLNGTADWRSAEHSMNAREEKMKRDADRQLESALLNDALDAMERDAEKHNV